MSVLAGGGDDRNGGRRHADAAALGRRRLRLLVAILFVGLALPAVLLIRQGLRQLELESFRREQILAEGVARRVDESLARAVAIEDARPFDDYVFAVTAGDGAASSASSGDAAAGADGGVTLVQRSPLAAFPPPVNVPGTIAYFQVDADGTLTTPLLPPGAPGAYGLDPGELGERAALANRLRDVLAENRLVRERPPGASGAPNASEALEKAEDSNAPQAVLASASEPASAPSTESSPPGESSSRPPAAPASARRAGLADVRQRAASRDAGASPDEEARGQAAFDRLSAANVAAPRAGVSETARDADREDVAGSREAPAESERPATETPGVGGQTEALADDATRPARQAARTAAFQSELDPLRFSRLDTGQFVLYRNAWHDGERYVQGILLEQRGFLDAIGRAFVEGGLSAGTQLSIAAGAELDRLALAPADAPADRAVPAAPAAAGPRLYSARLSPPLAGIELEFFAGAFSPGPGTGLVVWTAVVLFAVLIGGLFAMYRFGLKQIELARQQQNFVSAVSHELKTPLTSIRMYGEMLKSGWASDEKKQSYYDFIFAEGERLSRLIDNVLVLARLGRVGPTVHLEAMTVAAIVDTIRSKVASQAERAGVELVIETDEAVAEKELEIDPDAMAQVFINLVDNAIKFAARAERREIRIEARALDRERVVFAVRDFGPGIPADAMRRLFELFYRPDNELTRETAGTGIGLALVRGLVKAMGGRVDVRNCEPGAEFRVIFAR